MGCNFQNQLAYFKLGVKFSKYKVLSKEEKTLKLRPKMPYLGIDKLEIEKAFVIFHGSTLKFFKIQSFGQDQITSSLKPKLSHFGIFR